MRKLQSKNKFRQTRSTKNGRKRFMTKRKSSKKINKFAKKPLPKQPLWLRRLKTPHLQCQTLMPQGDKEKRTVSKVKHTLHTDKTKHSKAATITKCQKTTTAKDSRAPSTFSTKLLNLSSFPLAQRHVSLLTKGPKFTPISTPKEHIP